MKSFHSLSQCSNRPGNLIARNKGQGWAMTSLARPQIGIVHPCIGNLDQELSRSWLPNGHIASFKHLWPTEARYHYSFHQCLCPFLSLSLRGFFSQLLFRANGSAPSRQLDHVPCPGEVQESPRAVRHRLPLRPDLHHPVEIGR